MEKVGDKKGLKSREGLRKALVAYFYWIEGREERFRQRLFLKGKEWLGDEDKNMWKELFTKRNEDIIELRWTYTLSNLRLRGINTRGFPPAFELIEYYLRAPKLEVENMLSKEMDIKRMSGEYIERRNELAVLKDRLKDYIKEVERIYVELLMQRVWPHQIRREILSTILTEGSWSNWRR